MLVPVGIAAISSGIGAPAGIVLLAGASAASGGAVFWYNYNDEYSYAPPSIYEYDIEKLRQLEIFRFEIAP